MHLAVLYSRQRPTKQLVPPHIDVASCCVALIMEIGFQTEYDRKTSTNIRVPVHIAEQDRMKHTYIIGKTGMGKSTLLLSMLVRDIEAGNGCAFFDPHGEDAETLLNLIPPHRVKDVVYFNPADRDHPISFNPVDTVRPTEVPLVADTILDAFKHLWKLSEASTPRFERMFFNALFAVISIPNGTLLMVPALLSSQNYRTRIVPQISDSFIKNFWSRAFSLLTSKEQREETESTLNKVEQFLSDPTMRNILAQSKNRIDFDHIVDNRKIFIANLSQAEIGPQKARLLGGLLVAKLALASQKPHKHPFHVVIDEFQMFASTAFPHLLSTIRKFNMSLTLSHQYLDQLSPALRTAVIGNVGTIISFRLGHYDAQQLSPELDLPVHQLTTTPPHVFHMKSLEHTKHRVSTQPPKTTYNRASSIVANSRHLYARPVAEVTALIERFMVAYDK